MIKKFQEMPDEFNFDENAEGGEGFSLDKLQELEKMLTETLKSLGIDENEMMQGMDGMEGSKFKILNNRKCLIWADWMV